MVETLSSLFQRSQGAAVEIDGRLVQPIFQDKIAGTEARFLIRRIKSMNSPVQGLRLKAVKGRIKVNGQSHSEVILWADTSPASVEISVSSKSGCVLKAWNVWRVGDIAQAWVGNSGIHSKKVGRVVVLACSDGVGEVDFTDLVVEIEERG
jgi:hypothetical protein